MRLDPSALVRDYVHRLPNALSLLLLNCNKDPCRIFGPRYRHYRESIALRDGFDPVPVLKSVVGSALRDVPYYRKRDGNEIRIDTMEDFENFIDFIDKDTVLENFDAFISTAVDLSDYDRGTTGGTSGKPLTLLAPKNRYAVELASMHSIWAGAGFNFDVRAVIRNHRLKQDEYFRVNPFTREMIFDGFRLNDDYFAVMYNLMRHYRIRFLHCYPSVAYEFANFLYDRKLDVSFMTAFLSGSENVFAYQKDLIQGRLGIRFYNWYGHSEKLILAGNCPDSDLYHVEPAYGYFELIDSENHVIREPGKIGEMVGTAFHNPGMPLIRYRTGDFAEYVGERCPVCGRGATVIRNIVGRWSGDRIYNRDGSFVTTTALNLHTHLLSVISGLQYIQREKGELEILIVKSPDYQASDDADFYRHFRERLDPHTRVNIRYVDRLIRQPNGKFLHIISNVA
jgi:phenylacetate-CoA ligase